MVIDSIDQAASQRTFTLAASTSQQKNEKRRWIQWKLNWATFTPMPQLEFCPYTTGERSWTQRQGRSSGTCALISVKAFWRFPPGRLSYSRGNDSVNVTTCSVKSTAIRGQDGLFIADKRVKRREAWGMQKKHAIGPIRPGSARGQENSGGRTRTYNQPVNSRLLYH